MTGPSDQQMLLLVLLPGAGLVVALVVVALSGIRLRAFWVGALVWLGVLLLAGLLDGNVFSVYGMLLSSLGGLVVCAIVSALVLARRIEKGTA